MAGQYIGFGWVLAMLQQEVASCAVLGGKRCPGRRASSQGERPV